MDYYDLGSHHRKVATTSDEAQRWFDRGLVWMYAYNHEEAITCFERALAADPGCAMAHWGIAYAVGPNYNKPWVSFEPAEKAATIDRARAAAQAAAAAGSPDPTERALIEAIARRYPDGVVEEYGPWHDAFADAMRAVHRAHPRDLDVASLFAEAVMNRTPWQLWDLPSGQPAAGAGTPEAVEVLETAFRDDPAAWDHPGLLHMYIHLMEMSPTPERALRHGDRLRDAGARRRPPPAHGYAHRRALRRLPERGRPQHPRHRGRPQVSRARGPRQLLLGLPLPQLPLQASTARCSSASPPPRWRRRTSWSRPCPNRSCARSPTGSRASSR